MKTPSKIILRGVLYGAMILMLAAVAIPQYVKTRWTTDGVPFDFDVQVTDGVTGEPVSGAEVTVYFDSSKPVSAKAADSNSATTDQSGRCQVETYFPGTGTANKGRLRIDKTLLVRAKGFDDWERSFKSILGDSLEITTGPQVRMKHKLNVPLRKNPAASVK